MRFSLIPARISEILEPKMSPIIERIKAVNIFIEAGYEVHLNFSPIIAYEGWLTEYAKLFEDLDQYINNQYKPFIKAECIFLTHNDKQHERNIASNRLESEALIWQPNIQENKVSEYGSKAVRYKAGIKSNLIQRWNVLHNRLIPWNQIQYIF
ncbi:spore photoproduct lyase family protein [Rickettsia endosymbiont of Ixodes scapularis]|uniref:spore photoproduct lyase family protein n=1 Tax=Rickettsia endosymbiont of Ixodes scapularis TaxID=444612 RepID=UPI003527E924